MNGNVHIGDPWSGILHGLLASTSSSQCNGSGRDAHRLSSRDVAKESRRFPTERQAGGHDTARIVNVLDRLSERTVAVSWRDSTSCHYNDQIWRVGIARQPGCCAVTGMQIETGDAIYRPIPAFPAPLNAHAMILASAISRVQAEV